MNLVKLLDQEFSEDYKLEQAKKTNRLYDLIQDNKRSLFVTIGDSWTYGERLASEYSGSKQEKERFRIENCYGYTISRYLDSDFLNLSIPGSNNLWMVDKYKSFCKIASELDYDKIIIFITLTEYGREIGTDFDLDPALNDLYRKSQSCKDLALSLNEYLTDILLSYTHPKIDLKLGINYVTNLYPKRLQSHFVPRTWLEVLADKEIIEECIVVGSWVIPHYKDILNYNEGIDQTIVLEELNDMITTAKKRLDIIYNTGYNYKEGYRHPKTTGHQLWANYIIKNASFYPSFRKA